MSYNWYKIIRRYEFLALDIPSTEVTVILTGIGLKTILVLRGEKKTYLDVAETTFLLETYVSIVYEDVLLTCNLNGRNPFLFDTYKVFLDENDDVWLGILAE